MSTDKNLAEFRAPTGIEAIFNRVFGFLVGLGIGPKYIYLLQVRGRKSGRIFSTPVNLMDVDGKRILVAPRGRTQWVRNAEATGEIALKRGSFRQSFGLRPIADRQAGISQDLSGAVLGRGAEVFSGEGGVAGGGVSGSGGELSGV
jgi:hypothetical protein